MGQKTAGESIAAIIQAFLKRRTWSQAELARQVDLGVPALRKRILDLQASGMPLTDEKDHPHVYWSVPKHWFPGAVALEGKDVEVLLRLLGRLPKSKERDRLIKLTLESLPGSAVAAPPSDAVLTREASAPEEKFLDVVEDAARQKKPLRFRYYSASRGSDTWRHASVHRVVVGPPARFVAVCHRDDKLKWFRIDNVVDADVDRQIVFREADGAEVDDLVASSLDGFHDPSTKKERHAFFVREPEARWVAKNLLEGMKVEEEKKGGIRVSAVTTAVNRLARYVVGLGDAAQAETKALRDEVVRLARGAAAANQAGERES
jgi:predicted DNA-binding transcriptional regulator YafY